jgi:two-component system, NarL family, response regulator NreC
VVRIFLVDDNSMIRSHLRALLEKTDEWVVVEEAEDGLGAVERWEEVSPHVTVMDFVMPQMDGLEAGRRISQQHPDSRVLMMTIDPSSQLADEAKKAGFKGLCAKADLRCLVAAVEAVLKGKTYFQFAPAPAG